VLEVGVFDLTGLDALRRIAAERTDTPIIVVAKESDIPMTVLAMKAGAVEFLLKPLTDEELLDAIDHAITRSRAILSRKAEVRELRSRYESLSVREQQVDTGGGRPPQQADRNSVRHQRDNREGAPRQGNAQDGCGVSG